jgi:membrane protease YdiL (CAAX protease family)
MNVLQNWMWLGLQCLDFVVTGAVVYVLTRILRLRAHLWPFAQPRAAALWGLGAVLTGWLLVSILFFALAPGEAAPRQPTQTRCYDLSDVVSQAAIALVLLGPALLTMRWRREPWASAGVSRYNLGGSLVIGALLALLSLVSIFFGGEHSPGQVIGYLGSRHLWALLQYTVVGFGEEFAFRGYLQTRLVAWLGRWSGWVLTSVLMALAHAVQRLTVGGMPPLDALSSSASLIPISLFLGYVMLRRERRRTRPGAHLCRLGRDVGLGGRGDTSGYNPHVQPLGDSEREEG